MPSIMTIHYSSDAPIELAPGVYHLGVADEANGWANIPYLVVQGERAALIDPGSAKPDFFQCVLRKVRAVIDPRCIETMVVQHQDPDLCAALPLFEPLVHPQARIVCAVESALLVQHYGLNRPLTTVEDGEAMSVGDARTIRFFMTPYAHFIGAMMTYDDATKTLFSSDTFGGFSDGDEVFAGPAYKPLIGTFLGQYLGSKRALEYALNRITGIRHNAGIDRICPQHGCVIRGSDVPDYVEHAHQLEVGGEVSRLAARNRIGLRWREVQEPIKDGEFSGPEVLALVARLVASTPEPRREELAQTLAGAGFSLDASHHVQSLPSDLPAGMLNLYAALVDFPAAKVGLKLFLSSRGVPF